MVLQLPAMKEWQSILSLVCSCNNIQCCANTQHCLDIFWLVLVQKSHFGDSLSFPLLLTEPCWSTAFKASLCLLWEQRLLTALQQFLVGPETQLLVPLLSGIFSACWSRMPSHLEFSHTTLEDGVEMLSLLLILSVRWNLQILICELLGTFPSLYDGI